MTCLYIELFFITYVFVQSKYAWFLRSREGTLPFVEVNGEELVDSQLIIRDLEKKFHKEDLEADLTDEQKGFARSIEQMVEHNLLA